MTVVSFQTSQTLDQAVAAVHREFAKVFDGEKKSHNARINVGHMLIDLRKRIESGEAGEGKWWDWYRENIVRSRRDGEKCMRLASAEDPEEAAEDERTQRREGMRKSRASHVGRKQSPDVVERALQLVEQMTAAQRQAFVAAFKERFPW